LPVKFAACRALKDLPIVWVLGNGDAPSPEGAGVEANGSASFTRSRFSAFFFVAPSGDDDAPGSESAGVGGNPGSRLFFLAHVGVEASGCALESSRSRFFFIRGAWHLAVGFMLLSRAKWRDVTVATVQGARVLSTGQRPSDVHVDVEAEQRLPLASVPTGK
jgi:hypothetical protein